jgi:hypothetical protein
MLPQRTKAQAREIRKQLIDHGWRIASVEKPFEDEWWTTEIWLIESEWSPQGAHAYLTYLVDPQDDSHAPDIWEVRASADRPTTRTVGEDSKLSLYLGHGWLKELRAFIEGLDRLRAESQP